MIFLSTWPKILLLVAAVGLIALCRPADIVEQPVVDPGQAIRAAYFNLRFAEHCLGLDSSANPDEVRNERARLQRAMARADAVGAGPDVSAAEAEWRHFLETADFVCRDSEPAILLFRERIDQFVQAIEARAASSGRR